MNFNIVKSGFSLTDSHLHLKDNLEYSKGFFDSNYHNETLMRTILFSFNLSKHKYFQNNEIYSNN